MAAAGLAIDRRIFRASARQTTFATGHPCLKTRYIAGLCRAYTFSVRSARTQVASFVELNGLKIVGIGERKPDLAAQAYAEFGKGRHPAALNMGGLLRLCVCEG